MMETHKRQTVPILARIDRLLTWSALVLGGLTLTFMTVLSTVNVLLMRKALNDPIRGAEDLMVLSLVVVVALSIPFGARSGAHIEIEMLESYLNPRFSRFSYAVMKLIGTIITALLAWQLWLAGGQAGRFGESSQTLVISFGPFYRILSVAIAIYAIVLILEFIEAVRGRELTGIELTGGDKE